MEVKTEFASAERVSHEVILEQYAAVKAHLQTELLDASPLICLVLNTCRQIVFANTTAIDSMNSTLDDMLGVRPGELLACVYSERVQGCGTSGYCSECGTVLAIIGASSGLPTRRECQLLHDIGGSMRAMDLVVDAMCVCVGKEEFTLIYLQDNSDAKKRDRMERLFYHDILNVVSGMAGLSDAIMSESEGDVRELAALIHDRSLHMAHEIKSMRQLMQAEEGDLVVEHRVIDLDKLVDGVVEEYSRNEAFAGISVRKSSECGTLKSDIDIITRVLENMAKNAMEASDIGDVVEFCCERTEKHAVLSVRNPGAMADDVALQVFKRSFSTKGEGRGLGTYSIKLFTERYLGGSVGFMTGLKTGTVFWVKLPLEPVQPSQ